MSVRKAEARWEGTLKGGNGTMKMPNAGWEGPYTFSSRFEEGQGTNPEELIAAAHAGCFSMAFSADLERAGHPAVSVETSSAVHLERTDAGQTIVKIVLTTVANVPGISADKFNEVAEGAKKNCPVSRALAAVETIELNATLVN
jgi:osmotically inducible protein OsmC